jgi:hydroxymethylglutaryl-CoA lyase
MSLPTRITVIEVGPREGYQFEGIGRPDKISTADKIRLVDALAATGAGTIQVTSFVHPKVVPQMADAEAVVAGIAPRDGVRYTAVYLNDVGLKRAQATGRLSITGKITLTASEAFALKNQNRNLRQDREMQETMLRLYHDLGIPIENASIMAAFGCNYEGDVPLRRVLDLAADLRGMIAEAGDRLQTLILADTMGWANPEQIRRTVGAVRSARPDVRIGLHLHDTRGLGLAHAYAAVSEGVDYFDTAVGGLGGCPFAGHTGAAGNICTEELVFMCHELGIETGIDLPKMIACAALAEEIVGHPLPSKILHSGILNRSRQLVR